MCERLGRVVGHEVDGVDERPCDHVVDQFVEGRAIGGHSASRNGPDRSGADVPWRESAAARD